MEFCVLTLDYDGTIAREGNSNPMCARPSPDRKLQKFNVAGRLTLHVRHRSRYLEVAMHERHAFVFTCNERPFGNAACALKEFVTLLERVPDASLDGHARRSDFSRSIVEVFGDQPLAAAIRKVERQHRHREIATLRAALFAPIRERYELIYPVKADL